MSYGFSKLLLLKQNYWDYIHTLWVTNIGPTQFEYIKEYGSPSCAWQFEYINKYGMATRTRLCTHFWTRTRLCTQIWPNIGDSYGIFHLLILPAQLNECNHLPTQDPRKTSLDKQANISSTTLLLNKILTLIRKT